MLLKNKYIQLIVAMAVVLGSTFGVALQSVSAAQVIPVSNPNVAATDLKSLADDKHDCSPAKGQQLSKDNCGIVAFILVIINVLSGLVGVVIVLVIIVGGIQYSMAAGDPGKVAEARKRILNAVIALVLFIFSFSILQYLVPGGLF
jgi:hypothetical protein